MHRILAGAALACPLLLAPITTGAPQETAGEDISAGLEELRARVGVPGLVAIAIQEGEVVAWGNAGVRAQGKEAPIHIDDAIHLGSCTKAMTSTLAAILIEEGKLTWETTLAEALPEFAKKVDGGYGEVTLEAFLKHQAGIAERRRPEVAVVHGELRQAEGKANEVRLAILEKVLSIPPSMSAPGTFDYSNFGYMTAGAMMEGVTGKPWEELMVEKLFRPLGMTSAGIGSPVGENAAVGHTFEDGKWTALPPGPEGILPVAMGPAGLAHCNLRDWAKFVAVHLAGGRGEDGFLPAAAFARMHVDPGSCGYAAGWGVGVQTWDWDQAPMLSHNGSDGTWTSFVLGLPDWDLTILVATNGAEGAGGQAMNGGRDLMLKTLGFVE